MQVQYLCANFRAHPEAACDLRAAVEAKDLLGDHRRREFGQLRIHEQFRSRFSAISATSSFTRRPDTPTKSWRHFPSSTFMTPESLRWPTSFIPGRTGTLGKPRITSFNLCGRPADHRRDVQHEGAHWRIHRATHIPNSAVAAPTLCKISD